MTNAKHGCFFVKSQYLVVDKAGHKIALSVHCLSHTTYIEYIFLVDFSWQFRNVLKQILKHKSRTKLLNGSLLLCLSLLLRQASLRR